MSQSPAPGAPSGPYVEKLEPLKVRVKKQLTTRQKVFRWGAMSLAVAVIAAVVVAVGLPSQESVEANSPLVGHQAPEFSGNSIVNGQHIDLAGYRGQFVVVNFFASWCDPCAQEAPELEQFAYDSAQSGTATVIGIVFTDVNSTAKQFLLSTGATFQAVPDPGEKIAYAYGVRGPPETFIISPAGTVLDHIDGPVTDQQLNSLIAHDKAAGA